jgi:hypothetical protein
MKTEDLVRKKLIATISLLALLLSPSLISANAADFIDEQVFELEIPTQEAGWTGAFVDDSSVNKFSNYLLGLDETTRGSGLGRACDDFNSEDCAKYPYFSYNLYLPNCSASITDDCIVDFSAVKADGTVVPAKYMRSFPNETTPTFRGSKAINLPDGWYPSMWSFDGITHAGGENFMLRASLFAFGNRRADASIRPQLRIGVNAISTAPQNASGTWNAATRDVNADGLTNLGGGKGPNCDFFLGIKECATPWALPKDVRFKVEVKISSKLSGWVNGRLSDPNVVVTPNGPTGQTVLIEAAPMQVPIFAIWKRFSDLSPTAQTEITSVGATPGSIPFPKIWRPFYPGQGPEPFDKISKSFSMSNYDQRDFKNFLNLLAVSDDKSIATKSLWHFETAQNGSLFNDPIIRKCSKTDAGISGFVSTNSTMFLLEPPSFNKESQSLDYKVAAPHYDRNGKENIGRYNLVLDSGVARCIYGFTKAPIQASVSILNTDGTQQISTSTINEKNGWLYLAVNGYKYSAPTLKVKLSQEETVPTPAVEEPVAPTTGKVLPPVMINPLKAKSISVKMGKVVVFTVGNPEIWKGKVLNSAIAKFVPGGPQSSYETNPSLTILKKGKTSVSLTNGKKTFLLKLTVS